MRALLGRTRAWTLSATVTLGGCSSGASNDPALTSLMRIQGAQFVAGSMPAAQAGPEVASIDLLTNTIWPGYANEPLKGSLGESAMAVTLALSGDEGYWIVPAGVPDVSTPTLPTFRATASFSTGLAPGAYSLEAHAVDSVGTLGPPKVQTLTALPVAPSRVVQGELVVTLAWDTEADVDLHVLDPLGNEIYHGAPSSLDPFAQGTSVSSASPGVLDVDSNANCRADGLCQEDVIWAGTPPRGHYVVRVDTLSLCGQASAHWTVSVMLHAALLAEVTGTAFDTDTWGAHDRGAGVLALEFEVS
jgi:hypothetical protein